MTKDYSEKLLAGFNPKCTWITRWLRQVLVFLHIYFCIKIFVYFNYSLILGPYIYPRIPQNTVRIPKNTTKYKYYKDLERFWIFFSVDRDISQKATLIELFVFLNYWSLVLFSFIFFIIIFFNSIYFNVFFFQILETLLILISYM
jgi:hypothetical protein